MRKTVKSRSVRRALRSPALAAVCLCLCLLAGFLLGSIRIRRRSAEAVVVARAPAEQVRAIPADLVNINTADSQELQTLSGIGPALAERILAYREENGGFRYLYELTNVKGIGLKTFEGLQDLITLD